MEKTKLKPMAMAPGDQEQSKAQVDGERRRIIKKLHDLVIARLTEAYKEAGVPVPRDHGKPDYLSGIATASEALRSKKNKVIVKI